MTKGVRSRHVVGKRSIWAIGRAGATTSFVSIFSWLLSFCAVLSIGLGVGVIFVAKEAYEHRQDISGHREVSITKELDRAVGKHYYVDEFVNDRKVHVHLFDITGPGLIDPPLGVTAWPEKGSSAVSPAMLELLEASTTPDRFGTISEVIAPDALASPSELLVYASVPIDSSGTWFLAGSRGEGSDSLDGEAMYDRDVEEFYSLAVVLLILPGVVALMSAAGAMSESMRRRQHLLKRFGAAFWDRWLLQLPYAIPGPLAAAVALVILYSLSVLNEFRVPGTDQIIDPSWVSESSVPLLVSFAAIVLGSVFTNAARGALSRSEDTATRLMRQKDIQKARGPVSLSVLLISYPWVIFILSPTSSTALLIMVVMIASLTILLPQTVAFLFRSYSRLAVKLSLGKGDIGGFIGWRLTAYRSAAIARLLGAVVGIVVITGSFNVVQTLFQEPAAEALRGREITQDSIVAIDTSFERIDDLRAFAGTRDLCLGIGIVDSRTEEAWLDGSIDNRDLDCLGLSASDALYNGKQILTPASEAGGVLLNGLSLFGAPVQWKVGNIVENMTVSEREIMTIFIASTSGEPLDVWALNGELWREVSPLVSATSINQGWIVGALDLDHKSRWLTTLAVPGVIVLALVGALIWTLVVMAETRGLIASPYLRGATHVFYRIARIRLFYPFLVGGIAGSALTLWVLAPLHFPLPVAFLTVSAGAVAIVALLITAAASMHWASKVEELER